MSSRLRTRNLLCFIDALNGSPYATIRRSVILLFLTLAVHVLIQLGLHLVGDLPLYRAPGGVRHGGGEIRQEVAVSLQLFRREDLHGVVAGTPLSAKGVESLE